MNRAVVRAHRRRPGGLAAPQRRRRSGGDRVRRPARQRRVRRRLGRGAGRRRAWTPGCCRRPLPTPVLALRGPAARRRAGVMVTASHNPPQDNGYKVYAADGAQIVPPVDAGIEAAIGAVGPLSTVPMSYACTVLGDEVLESYVDSVAAVPRTRAPSHQDVHTALHGVGAAVLRPRSPGPGSSRRCRSPSRPSRTRTSRPCRSPTPRSPARSTWRWRWPSGPAPTCCWPATRTRTGARWRCRTGDRLAALTGDELGVLLADHLIRSGRTGTYATTIVSSSLLLEALRRPRGAVRGDADRLQVDRPGRRRTSPTGTRRRSATACCRTWSGTRTASRPRCWSPTSPPRSRPRAARCRTGWTSWRPSSAGTRPRRSRSGSRTCAQIAATMAALRADPPAHAARPAGDRGGPAAGRGRAALRADGVRVVVRPSGTEPKLKAYLEVVGDPAGLDGAAGASWQPRGCQSTAPN